MSNELFYIPNLLSILRIVLLIPVSYLMIYSFESSKDIIVFLMILMYLTDILDGYIARKFNQVSDLGKIIDPLADKVTVIVVTIILYFQDLIPTWFLAVIILRDILIFSFGIYINRRKNITLMSNVPGKVTVLAIGIILLLTVINYELFAVFISYFYYIVLILILYSTVLYYIRFKKTIGEKFHAN